MSEIQFLKPFTRFCMTIGNLPSSYLVSMTYEEQLLWLCDYLEKTVIPTINNNSEVTKEIQNLFNQLKNYVEHYFDNLDVQEEINNKLDEMTQDGTLESIIGKYINNNIARIYNNLDELKNDFSLIPNMKCKTLGYYSLNDGGGSFYYIRKKLENDIEDTGNIIFIKNNNVAELIIENDCVNVKQFGAIGDGINNDDVSFSDMIKTNCKKFIIPYSTYLVQALSFPENCIVEGNNSLINCKLDKNIDLRLISFNNNSVINNLNINCLNEDREWNRIDLTNKSFITFNHCNFSGFRQQTLSEGAVGQNVWALYFKQCHDIRIINCNFQNNSFQDIFFEYDVNNIYFENINRTDSQKGVVVDIEPEFQNYVKNITFINCFMDEFECFEYHNEMNKIQNVTLIDCTINRFHYSGGNVRIINSPITQYKSSNFLPFSGVLDLINSVNFSKNLLSDPYISTLSAGNENSKWIVSYVTGNWKNFIKKQKTIKEGIFTTLNYNNTSNSSVQITSEPINCSSGETFLIKTLSKSKFPSEGGTGAIGKQLDVLFYNEDNSLLLTLNCSLNRANLNDVMNFSYKSNIVTAPENATYFKIRFKNGSNTSFSLDIKNVSVHKINFNTDTNNINNLPSIDNQEFNLNILPTINFINYFKGDKIIFSNPTNYIGAIATNDGNENYGSDALWKNYGAIVN